MFKEDGAQVIACDVDEPRLKELEELDICAVIADVSKPKEVERLINLAIETTGKLDVLFNNAGMGFGYKLEDFPDGSFEHHVSVHLFWCRLWDAICHPIYEKTRLRTNY